MIQKQRGITKLKENHKGKNENKRMRKEKQRKKLKRNLGDKLIL